MNTVAVLAVLVGLVVAVFVGAAIVMVCLDLRHGRGSAEAAAPATGSRPGAR